MKHLLIPGLLLTCLAATAVPAADAAGAKTAIPKPMLSARVATGLRVDVVPSARTQEQWAARRPHYQDLRPRIHTASE